MISVVVPIYNMKDYLDKCIKSIVEQTYQNIEIILVDDGSTDCSLEICQAWAKKDSRIIVLHKGNGGQGSARNMALDIAQGDYIGFVDSDDWIHKSMYQTLYDNMTVYGADVSCCSTGEPTETGNGEIKTFEQPEIMWEHLQNHKGTGQSPCDKLYKRTLFDDVRFPELRAYEDCATIYRILHNAKMVVVENTVLYYYIHRENSTMTCEFSPRKYQAIDAYFQMYQDYAKKCPQYAFKAKQLLLGSIQFCIGETLTRNKKDEWREQYHKARSIARSMGGKGLPIKSKILRRMIILTPRLYGIIYKALK